MKTIFKLPQMSMTMVDGVVKQWLKSEGDFVETNEALLEVETDKMVKELTSPVSGYLTKVIAFEGDIVPVDGELCELADSAEQSAEESAQTEEPGKEAAPEEAAPAVTVQKNENKAKVRISPLAKKISELEGIDYSSIKGTGPMGTIVKRDIENAKDSAAAVAKAEAEPPRVNTAVNIEDNYKVIPFRGIRKAIADNMMASKQNTAFLTTVAEVNLSKIKECRKYLHLSYTTFAIAAVAKALEDDRFEMMRSRLEGDKIYINQNIGVNVSVATGGSLVTPVIRDANKKNIITIGKELGEVSTLAREGKLDPSAFEGGCFTITNSGVFGSLFYTPIINYPQSAILGMGKILETAVVEDGEIKIAPMMYICLSYDHRLIDGEVGAPFLQKVKYYLQNPEEMINA